MKTRITLDVDTECLSGFEDGYIAALWHAAQINPAPIHDREACELVRKLGFEIVRRWLEKCPPQIYSHQSDHAMWFELQKVGSWSGPDGAFRLDRAKVAVAMADRVEGEPPASSGQAVPDGR